VHEDPGISDRDAIRHNEEIERLAVAAEAVDTPPAVLTAAAGPRKHHRRHARNGGHTAKPAPKRNHGLRDTEADMLDRMFGDEDTEKTVVMAK
jgi:hypothetical protein